MSKNVNHPYEELFAYQRPKKQHPPMDLQDRAKIFSPFAALTGHGDAIKDMQEARVNRRLLSESEADELNQKLATLKKGRQISLTYFEFDPGSDGSGYTSEGRYVTLEGSLKKIDKVEKTLILDGDLVIYISDIAEIELL